MGVLPLVCDIQVDGKVVVLRGAVELQLGRVSCSGHDLVALLQALLDKLIAKAGRSASDEENLLCHGCDLCEVEEL